jgi:predicted RND superfamily exporter protein
LVSAFWRRLGSSVLRRPLVFVAASVVLSALGLWGASRLDLKTDFAALLPPGQASVVELNRVLAETRGVSQVFVVLEGRDVPAMRRFADALVPRLLAVGRPWVESAEDGVQAARAFLLPRAGLFASDAQLDELLGDIKEHERWAFQRGIGADLSDPPAPLDAARVREVVGGGDLDQLQRFPDGYYQGPGRAGEQALVVIARAAVASGDLGGARQALARVQATVAETARLHPADAAAARVGYAGDLVTGLREYTLVRDDVVHVGLLGVALVLGVLLLFFRNPGVLLALGTTIAAGCALTFGVADVAIGHLNVATAFLFSIIAGNGINFGIIWMARYLEERRRGSSQATALHQAYANTWAATLTAAGAAAAAYAALGVSGFRGFRDFAVIGASGMLLCWAASYTLLPALTVAGERARDRLWPASRSLTPEAAPLAWLFDVPFTRLVAGAPRLTAVAGMLLAALALGGAARYLARDPVEYDMRALQSDPRSTAELYRVSALAASIVGANAEGAMVVVTDDPRDTPAAAAALRKVRDSAPAGAKPFEAVHTLHDFVPPDQPERLPRVLEIARRLGRAHDRGAFDDDEWRRIAPFLPPPDLRPFGLDDLPAELQRAFTTRDGVRGRLLYIEPTRGRSDSDLRYLIDWADAFRETRLPDGRVVRGSGRAVIFADLLRATLVDMPRAVMLSLLVTGMAVMLLFGRARPAAVVLGTLAVGVVGLVGALAGAHVRLNFINLIALPITFGIGVDYAVNLLGRYRTAPEAGILAAMRGAGGPVVLCSLTTSLGYLALLRSHNQAVRSLGAVAVLGEASCLLAAMLVLPAVLRWRELSARGRFRETA